jgi:transcriptional regulator of NAD metabolism
LDNNVNIGRDWETTSEKKICHRVSRSLRVKASEECSELLQKIKEVNLQWLQNESKGLLSE